MTRLEAARIHFESILGAADKFLYADLQEGMNVAIDNGEIAVAPADVSVKTLPTMRGRESLLVSRARKEHTTTSKLENSKTIHSFPT